PVCECNILEAVNVFETKGARLLDGIYRNHRRRYKTWTRKCPGNRYRIGRCTRDASYPRSTLWLRDLPGAMAQSRPRAFCRARPIGCHPPGGRTRTRADGFRGRIILGYWRKVLY